MHFSETTIRGIFDTSIRFCIPVYQRAYSWQKENWDVFLQDLIEQLGRENEYSYGNLLLETIKKDMMYDVIDGQQRLTTLIIFVRALYNSMKAQGMPEDEYSDLQDFFVKKGQVRLRTVDGDAACFNSLIIEDTDFPINSSSQECIAGAKDYFTKELMKRGKEDLPLLRDIILNSKINRLELEGKKEAALMFELQNNRGRNLTNMEKLKSYFMYQMYVNSSAEDTDRNVECVSNYFTNIYRNIYDIKGIDEDSVLIYHCFAYLHVSFGYRNLDDIKKELAQSDDKVAWIKDFSRELATTFGHLKELQNCTSVYYRKLYRVRNKVSLPPFIYPFIIKGYKFLAGNESELNRLFHVLEVLAFRDQVISSRADLNSRLMDPLRGFNGDVEQLRIALRDKLNETPYWNTRKMRETISGWMYDNPALHYLLWEYEESIQRKGYRFGNIKLDNEQIEHISPQTPTDGKPLETGYDVDENNMYSEEFCSKYLNSLGNLMLISGSHNASIGNKPFAKKLETYKETPLLRQHSEIARFVFTVPKETSIAPPLDGVTSL